jgi:hypothetical protein
MRSSGWSTSVSSTTDMTLVRTGRMAGGAASGRSLSAAGASTRRAPCSRLPNTWRSVATSSSVSVPGSSTTRCSTRPVSVMSTEQQAVRAQVDDLEVATELRDSDGYCTTATWRVSWASSGTERRTTSSRSTAPSRKDWMARFSAGDSGLTVDSWSTNSR